MIFSSWNIWGLNKPRKQKEFKIFLLTNKIDMVDIFETKVRQSKAKVIQKKFGTGWTFVDNYSEVPKGRIWIGWKTMNVTISVIKKSSQLIHCHIQDKTTNFYCYGTFIYGLHTVANRSLCGINLGTYIPRPMGHGSYLEISIAYNLLGTESMEN